MGPSAAGGCRGSRKNATQQRRDSGTNNNNNNNNSNNANNNNNNGSNCADNNNNIINNSNGSISADNNINNNGSISADNTVNNSNRGGNNVQGDNNSIGSDGGSIAGGNNNMCQNNIQDNNGSGGNNEGRNNNKRRKHHKSTQSARSKQQQARSTSRLNERRALEKFKQQSEQFDTGSKKFKEKLEPTVKELIDYVRQDWEQKYHKSSKKLIREAAEELARRERTAHDAVSRSSRKVLDGQHGALPFKKPDHVIRFMFENWNSLCLGRGKKRINEINDLAKKYQVDLILGCETQYDWRCLEDELQFDNLFGVGERSRSIAANNTTERKVAREQHGGTAAVALGRLAGHVIDVGQDPTGLGRWCWILLGIGNKRTRVIATYQPSQKNKNSKGHTVFEQHERYFEPRGDMRSPRTIYYEQLTNQLKEWKAAGEDLLMFGDYNENVYTGRIAKRLAEEDINMTEQFQKVNSKQLPPTHIRSETAAVCAVFATEGAECLSACILPKFAGVGDHRCFILDFSSPSVLGTDFPNIVRPMARKLHCDSERIRDNYNAVLTELCDQHRIFHRLNQLAKIQDSNYLSASEFMLLFNKWDQELTELMRAAENKCNTFKHSHIPFSPEVGEWITRRWLLGRTKRFLLGKVPDPRNLFRQCRKHRLPDPRDLTMDELNMEIYICCKKIEDLKPQAAKMRRDHLRNCLTRAKEDNDLDRVLAIENILRRESTQKRWRRVKQTTGKPRGGAVTAVKVPTPTESDPQAFTEYNTADGIFNAMSDNLCERFRLAFTAKSYSGKLFDDIGYLGDTEATKRILEGTYEFDENEDPATRLILEEAAHTFSQMSGEEISTYVTVEDFQYYWQRANERISSSYSGLHYGHYKAASFDVNLSALHAQKLTMAAKAGMPLDRWGIGVTVLLEKICGNNYAHKLRAICLLEADMNWWNKLIFARRMMKTAKEKGVIPDESFAKKGSHVDHALMVKRWFADISKILHWPAALGGCDFSDCYDRAAHGPASIGLQAWGIPPAAVAILLRAMQTMQFCVRTGFGESDKFYGGSEEDPLAGYGQGNGAAPPAFSALSALIVNAYKRMGSNGAKLTSSYTARMFLLAAVMYVDDTDLCHMTPTVTSSDEELIQQVQTSTNSWTHLGQATGGAMKPPKCFLYLMSYKFPNGVPRLKQPHELPPPIATVKDDSGRTLPCHITVPQPDGSHVPIPTLNVKDPSEMLGFWFNPLGDGIKHVSSIKQKGINWVDRNVTRPLSRSDTWLSFYMQLIPGMTWGLLAVTMPPEQLEKEIMSLYYKILPLVGVNRNITKGWRTIPCRYQGLGMPNFVVLVLACKLHFLMCFWGFNNHVVGIMLYHAYEAFQMEVGLGGNILTRDFAKLGCLATEGTWFRNFWEYLHHLGVHFTVHDKYHLQPIRDGDVPIMDVLAQLDGPQHELVRLNRVRKFHKVTYLSEAALCDGRSIDPAILTWDPKPELAVRYSLEKPTPTLQTDCL